MKYLFRSQNKPVWIAIALTLSVYVNLSASASQESFIDDLPDPTLPPTIHATTSDKLEKNNHYSIKLQSILHSGTRRSAVINGHLKTIGSPVDGGHIIEIKHNAVVISRNGHNHTLRLIPAAGVSQRENQP